MLQLSARRLRPTPCDGDQPTTQELDYSLGRREVQVTPVWIAERPLVGFWHHLVSQHLVDVVNVTYRISSAIRNV